MSFVCSFQQTNIARMRKMYRYTALFLPPIVFLSTLFKQCVCVCLTVCRLWDFMCVTTRWRPLKILVLWAWNQMVPLKIFGFACWTRWIPLIPICILKNLRSFKGGHKQVWVLSGYWELGSRIFWICFKTKKNFSNVCCQTNRNFGRSIHLGTFVKSQKENQIESFFSVQQSVSM